MDTQDMAMPKSMYPHFEVDRVKDPNKFWAIPLVGALLKIIILIPVLIELGLVGIAAFFVVFLINPFIVLFSGSYWETAHSVICSLMYLGTKTMLFMTGVSDTYPGFSLEPNDEFKLTIPMPKNPNKLFAIPFLGLAARAVLLIPYFVFVQVVNYAELIALFGSWVPVLFSGRYPDTTYELVRDHQRISLATMMYITGLSDTYPTFWISMNHKNIKIALLIAGALLFIMHNVNQQQNKRPVQNPWTQRYYSAPSSNATY